MGSPEEAQKAIDAMNGKQLEDAPSRSTCCRVKERPGGGAAWSVAEFRGGGGGGGRRWWSQRRRWRWRTRSF